MKPFEQQTHYELLELPPSAREQEIHDAYARAQETYAPDSVALYALEDAGVAQALRDRLKVAYETLTDRELRAAYDRELTQRPAAPPRVRAEEAALGGLKAMGELIPAPGSPFELNGRPGELAVTPAETFVTPRVPERSEALVKLIQAGRDEPAANAASVPLGEELPPTAGAGKASVPLGDELPPTGSAANAASLPLGEELPPTKGSANAAAAPLGQELPPTGRAAAAPLEEAPSSAGGSGNAVAPLGEAPSSAGGSGNAAAPLGEALPPDGGSGNGAAVPLEEELPPTERVRRIAEPIREAPEAIAKAEPGPDAAAPEPSAPALDAAEMAERPPRIAEPIVDAPAPEATVGPPRSEPRLDAAGRPVPRRHDTVPEMPAIVLPNLPSEPAPVRAISANEVKESKRGVVTVKPRTAQPQVTVTPARRASRGLESAQHLAQASAITMAEAALAKVSVRARENRAEQRSEPRLRGVEINDATEFNGELLRRIRESRGWTIQQLADRTRITLRHLENLEADRYDALPTTVYLRGFLTSLAREFGLDPVRVAKSYLALVAKHKGGT